jgi:hypothetical protein
MISAATEGVPFTSIHIRGEFVQDAVLALGFFLAAAGVILGFSFGQHRKRARGGEKQKQTPTR